jgi:hypothetical protein
MVLTSPLAALGGSQEYGLAILNGILSVLTANNAAKISKKLWPHPNSFSFVITSALVYAAILPSSLALMESAAALFFMTVVVLNVLNRSPAWAGMAVLLPLIRPEYILMLPLLAVHRVRAQRWSYSAVEILLPASLICALGGWYLSVFGITIPQSIIAKSVIYQISFQEFCTFLFRGLTGSSIPLTITLIWLITFLLLLLVNIWQVRTITRFQSPSFRVSLTILIFPFLLILLYAMRRVLLFPWYIPLISVPVILALTPLWQRKWNFSSCLGAIGLLPIFVTGVLSSLITLLPEYSVFGASGCRAATLRKIGVVLASIYPESTIVAPEIGGLGRGFSGDIVDAAGLASPKVVPHHPLRIPEQRAAGYLGSVPPALVGEIRPDFIVGLPTLLAAVAKSAEIAEYQRIEVPITYTTFSGIQHPINVWGNNYVIIFARKSLAQAVQNALLKIDG